MARWMLAGLLLVACSPSVPQVQPLSAIAELDSLRRQFGPVTIANEYLGQYVAVTLGDGRRSEPTNDLETAIRQLFALTHGVHDAR